MSDKQTQQQKLADRLHAHASENYNDGWDTYVECGMEYCLEFVGDLTTWADVMDMAKKINSVTAERRADAAYYRDA